MSASKITGRQIAAATIDDSNIAAGAAIASSKLADGANFTKKDGSVAFTGNQSMGNNKITSLATPTASGDAATMGYVDGLIAGLNTAYKYRNVRAATTGNVTISNPGTSSFDGVTLSNGDRLLVRAQTTGAENGVYVFNGSSSALTRAADSDAWAELTGTMVFVDEGTTYVDTKHYCTSNSGGTLGSSTVTYAQDTSTGLSASNFVHSETPSGTVNGSNTSFSLANTPTSGTVRLFLNGQRLNAGAGNDYTISGGTITMGVPPVSGDVLLADYMK